MMCAGNGEQIEPNKPKLLTTSHSNLECQRCSDAKLKFNKKLNYPEGTIKLKLDFSRFNSRGSKKSKEFPPDWFPFLDVKLWLICLCGRPAQLHISCSQYLLGLIKHPQPGGPFYLSSFQSSFINFINQKQWKHSPALLSYFLVNYSARPSVHQSGQNLHIIMAIQLIWSDVDMD